MNAAVVVWVFVFTQGPATGMRVGPVTKPACEWLARNLQRDLARRKYEGPIGYCTPNN